MKIKKQQDIRDCGIVVLQSLHNYFYGEWIDINTFKQDVSYGEKGINISGLSLLAENFGMKLTPMKGNFNALSELKIKEPLIALIGNTQENHFVIIIKKTKSHFYYLDPLSGSNVKVSYKIFEEKFLNVIINVDKTSYVKKENKKFNIFEPLIIFRRHLYILFMSAALSIVITMTTSLFLKLIMDKVIPSGMYNTLTLLTLSFVSIMIFGAINTGVRNYIIYKIYLKVNSDMFDQVMDKLYNCKLESLDKLTKIDVLRRINLIDPISLFISSTLFSVFMDGLSLTISIALMIWISPNLFAFSLIGGILIVITTLITQNLTNKKYDPYIKSQLSFNTSVFDSINTLRNQRKKTFKTFVKKKVSKGFVNFKRDDSTIWNINNLSNVIETIISSVVPVLIIGISTSYVIQNKITVGAMVLFVSMFNFFINPLKNISTIIIKFPLVKKEINMLEFIFDMPSEPSNPWGTKVDQIDTIELKNFNFEYEVGKKILKTKSFKITKDMHLTGPNGSGKTTLFNILNFNYICDGVFINDMEAKYYSLDSLRSQVYTNQPNDFIHQQTVLEYATLGEPKKIEELIKTIKRNGVLKMMKEKEITLDKMMLNNADNMSSGQRQIVKLLPLFSGQYSLILMDEALENLEVDVKNKLSKEIAKTQKKARFIEVSHTGKFIRESEEVGIESLK